jgi:hypothetical protein
MDLIPSCNGMRIDSFSPNCLMGTAGAVARVMFGVPNLSKLFFNHSYVYRAPPVGLCLHAGSDILEATFTRELPLTKEAFLDRLARYYGITFLHKPYTEFGALTDDLARLAAQRLPVLSEIDFFHVPGHPFYRQHHDGHMMIVTGRGHTPGTLRVVEAVFGEQDFPLTDYRAAFEDARCRGRPFYLVSLEQFEKRDRPLDAEAILSDLERSLTNLESPQAGQGRQALAHFAEDFARFHDENSASPQRPFLIPGVWAFMCTAMNNARFLAELAAEAALDNLAEIVEWLRRKMFWLNKKWFAFNLAMERSMQERAFALTAKMPKVLSEIVAREDETAEMIAALRDGVAAG